VYNQKPNFNENFMARVLLVDDEPDFADAAAQILRLKSHEVTMAGSLGDARRALGASTPDVLLLDLMLPDGSGLELLDEISHSEIDLKKVVLITGHPAIKSQITDLSGPAISYLTKPISDVALLGLFNELEQVGPGAMDSAAHYGFLVGESPQMHAVYRSIAKIAPTDCAVLIAGETGTGKELVARALHMASGRPGEFVAVNSGSLPRELAGSELFGHKKGSFTGATRQHAGVFERAHGGTLFLDELTDMPIELQSHLLRVLETGTVAPVGSEKELAVDTRVIAATNRSPEEAIAEKLLREDLYYRLSVFPIHLPPLRQRREDIPLLAEHFLRELTGRYGKRRWLSPESLERLKAHDWPGNVREFRHVIHRAFILSDAASGEVQLPDTFRSETFAYPGQRESAGISVGQSIKDLERELILRTLEHFDGDKKKAVEVLGISLNTLYNRLHMYGEGLKRH
jgi:two-component system, NtrC family, response regulator HydG